MDSDILRDAFDLFVRGWRRPWNYVAGLIAFSVVVTAALWWLGVI
jgi:hypothetical protein